MNGIIWEANAERLYLNLRGQYDNVKGTAQAQQCTAGTSPLARKPHVRHGCKGCPVRRAVFKAKCQMDKQGYSKEITEVRTGILASHCDPFRFPTENLLTKQRAKSLLI